MGGMKINTCNGFYCDWFSPNKAYKPKVWTETGLAWSDLGVLSLLGFMSWKIVDSVGFNECVTAAVTTSRRDGIAEVLLSLERIEQDEELTYEVVCLCAFLLFLRSFSELLLPNAAIIGFGDKFVLEWSWFSCGRSGYET
ncbi:hypothetical protein IFM89_022672 [Coptis chinensis]|uniref:Uncharacterized protein n=1 Tax=Coptis chinensis TaxID=261450 RepID=A0A835GXE9_9MAGN|nr:hypothetical protein IFM89_022672 [Coptis chinensis]